MVNDLFKQALKLMLEEDDFPKIINTATGIDKKYAKQDFDDIKEVASVCNIEEMPFIALLKDIKSPSVLKEIIAYMGVIENRLIKGETKNG